MMILTLISQFIEPALTVTPIIYEAWLPIAMAVASLAATGYGMYQKTQASNKLRNEQTSINNKMKSLADYYKNESERDYLTTDSSKSVIRNLTNQLRNANKKTSDVAAKSGATQEAQVAAKGENLGRYNETISRLASHGDNYKQGMLRNYSGMLRDVYSGNANLYGADVNSWGNFANNSASALSQSLGTLDSDLLNGNDKKV